MSVVRKGNAGACRACCCCCWLACPAMDGSRCAFGSTPLPNPMLGTIRLSQPLSIYLSSSWTRRTPCSCVRDPSLRIKGPTKELVVDIIEEEDVVELLIDDLLRWWGLPPFVSLCNTWMAGDRSPQTATRGRYEFILPHHARPRRIILWGRRPMPCWSQTAVVLAYRLIVVGRYGPFVVLHSLPL